MVLRLGKFFARSTIATRVPINGPSTLGSAKMPAVCIPLSGCDAFALDANMFCVCCICCVVRCCSMGQFGCRFVLTRRRTTTKSEAAGKPHSDADADRDRKMLATLRYRERARLHWRLGSSFFFLKRRVSKQWRAPGERNMTIGQGHNQRVRQGRCWRWRERRQEASTRVCV